MSGYTRNPGNPKDLVIPRITGFIKFWSLESRVSRGRTDWSIQFHVWQNCTVSKRFSTFVKRPTSCIPPQLLEVFLSQPLSGIACKEIIFTTSFHHLKILEKPGVKKLT